MLHFHFHQWWAILLCLCLCLCLCNQQPMLSTIAYDSLAYKSCNVAMSHAICRVYFELELVILVFLFLKLQIHLHLLLLLAPPAPQRRKRHLARKRWWVREGRGYDRWPLTVDIDDCQHFRILSLLLCCFKVNENGITNNDSWVADIEVTIVAVL